MGYLTSFSLSSVDIYGHFYNRHGNGYSTIHYMPWCYYGNRAEIRNLIRICEKNGKYPVGHHRNTVRNTVSTSSIINAKVFFSLAFYYTVIIQRGIDVTINFSI